MQQLVKLVFFFVAAVFIVSYLNTESLSGGLNLSGSSSGSRDGLSDRNEYNRSYDTNADGFVSDEEYRQGEINRIAQEVEELEDAVAEALQEHVRSPYHGMITLSMGAARSEHRNDEYLVLHTNYRNETSINITGWQVKSLMSGRRGVIKQGVQLLEDRPWRNDHDIYIAPGDTAIITSGSAAGIATSFLTNSCMGYFDRDRFTPSIWGNCPLLEDEDLDSFGLGYDDFRREDDYDACMDAIESVRSCEIVRSPDRDLEDDCRDFIKEYSNYDGCVELHKDDADFYGDEWRIFLGSSKNDLWRYEREAIALYDAQGRVVDVLRY